MGLVHADAEVRDSPSLATTESTGFPLALVNKLTEIGPFLAELAEMAGVLAEPGGIPGVLAE